MKLDTVFRGCMRPAMFMGVPMMPFMLSFFMIALPAFMFSLLIFLLFPIAIVIMQQLIKYDEHFFDIIFLKMNTKIKSNTASRIDNALVLIAPMNADYKPKL
jgi:type IV secretion system protein VirB3